MGLRTILGIASARRASWRPILALLAAAACGEPDLAGSELDELAVDCGGKCDGLDGVRSLVHDPDKTPIDKLLQLGAEIATDQLNDALATEHTSITIETAQFHTEEDLDELVSGLVEAFGHRELSTEVNQARLRHLDDTKDNAYAEMGVELGGQFTKDWEIDVPGFETGAIGFNSEAKLATNIIVAVEEDVEHPLAAVKGLRDFAVPRSLADLREMKPGELFSLHGEGTLGLNIGVGVPLLVAEPVATVGYTVVLTAGLRTRLGGTLDTQLIKLDDNEVVVDVGISNIEVKEANVAIEDGFGVQGLLQETIGDVKGVDGVLDLHKLVDDALTEQLNERLNIVSLQAKRTKEVTRMSVARMRFNLDIGNPDHLGPAIAQAMHGDVRLAQALGVRKEPGVIVEFDVLRSGVTTTSSAGGQLFGIKLLRETVKEQGSAVIQTPGRATSLLWDSLHRARQLFSPRHGYTRVSIAGLIFNTHRETEGYEEDDDLEPSERKSIVGHANLFIEVDERDGRMQREKLIDHLDGIILGIAGADVMDDLARAGDGIQRDVAAAFRACERQDPRPAACAEQARASAAEDVTKAQAAVDAAVDELPGTLAAIVSEAAAMRLLAQSTHQFGNGGPATSIVAGVRLHDGALASMLTQRDGGDLQDAVEAFLLAAEVDRDLVDDERTDRQQAVSRGTASGRQAMGDLYDDAASAYRRLLEVEEAEIETLGLIGPNAVEIRFPVAGNRPLYDKASAQSVAQARARITRDLFDALRRAAKGMGPHAEQTVAYSLLALVDPAQMDLRLDLDMEFEGDKRQHYVDAGWPTELDLHGEGPDVEPIDGGLFDVYAVIDGLDGEGNSVE